MYVLSCEFWFQSELMKIPVLFLKSISLYFISVFRTGLIFPVHSCNHNVLKVLYQVNQIRGRLKFVGIGYLIG